MRDLGCFKDFEVSPIDGFFDSRSPDGEVGDRNFRLVLNVNMIEAGKRCRMGGWKKLFSDSIYGFYNQDLHDQLLCLATYYQDHDMTVIGGGQPSGIFSFPYFQPSYDRLGDTVTTIEDYPHCGYWNDYAAMYPGDEDDAFGCHLYAQTIGFPYVLQLSNPGTMGYSDGAASSGIQGDGTINWNRSHVNNGHAYLNALEAVNGPSQAITDARTFLGDYTQATNNTADPKGSFSGTEGVISWQYFLEYDSESGRYFTEYSFTGPGTPYGPCTSGPPFYYLGSTFFLACNYTDTYTYGGYNYGTPTEGKTGTFAYLYEYCGTYGYIREGCREAITLLKEFASDETSRKLIAATQTRIYQLNERTGNWRIIADGLGGLSSADTYDCTVKAICDCGQRRFRAAQLGNYMLFTNNFDPVLAYLFDQTASGCEMWSAQPVEDLVALEIDRAVAITSWKGFMFIGNITSDGQAFPDRVMWSDFNNALSWIPLSSNEAGAQDIGFSQKILAMEPLGDFLYIYTDTSVVQVTLVDKAAGRFRFREMYKGAAALRYPNTLVNTGDAHIYFGNDGIYSLTLFDTQPQRLEWIHRASGAVFKGVGAGYVADFDYLDAFGPINKSECNQAVGGYDDTEKCVWYSWPTDDAQCPNMSLVLNLRYGSASLVDHGFTAFSNYRADTRPNIRDWLKEQKICQPSQLPAVLKEGTPYPGAEVPFVNPPLYLFNPTENLDLPMHQDSWCARLGDLHIQDICETCDAGTVFVMASATDYSLKQFTPDLYYRERFSPGGTCSDAIWATAQDGAVYCSDGYSSMMQSDMNTFGISAEKLISRVLIDYEAEVQSTPNRLAVQIAYGAQPKCTTWKDIGHRDLRCLTEETAARHEADNTRPDLAAKYPTWYRGRYIGYRFYVDAVEGGTKVTGGGSCFNRVELRIRKADAGAR